MKTAPFDQFVSELADAYEHIYDLVYLRTHPFLNYLYGDTQGSTKEKAWQLHHTLLNAIEELDPGPQVPAFSREWRRHRLMVLRYVDGLTPQAVADQLAISRRHYYREHEGATTALAHVLWRRVNHDVTVQADSTAVPSADQAVGAQPTITDRMELLRLETAHLAQIERRARLPEVLDGVMGLLNAQAQKRSVDIRNSLPESSPDVRGDRRLIRQLLLGLVGHLINVVQHGTIELSTNLEGSRLILSIVAQPDAELTGSIEADTQTPLSTFEELAMLNAATLEPLKINDITKGFEVGFSLFAGQRTVLIVDDNEDILELFQRYLKLHKCEVITVGVASEVLGVARKVHPAAIVLDLMMPDQDGWDLMQILTNQPETQAIPIVVCSVLRQRELALSLGATAFLEKPVSVEKFLSVLDRLVADV